MKPRIYIETSIPSYLTERRSRDLVMAANQKITEEWWETRGQFELYLSVLVIQEASFGDSNASRKRLEVLENIPELEVTAEAEHFAEALLQKVPLPEKARMDALHISIAP